MLHTGRQLVLPSFFSLRFRHRIVGILLRFVNPLRIAPGVHHSLSLFTHLRWFYHSLLLNLYAFSSLLALSHSISTFGYHIEFSLLSPRFAIPLAFISLLRDLPRIRRSLFPFVGMMSTLSMLERLRHLTAFCPVSKRRRKKGHSRTHTCLPFIHGT